MSDVHPGLRFADLKIFLVDDDDAIAWGIETELRALGAEVKRANSIRQALDRYPSWHADLAISDINLPDGNGLDLLKRWQKEDPSMPVIMITAHGAVDSAITALRHDAFDYLQKPFDMKDLIAAIKRAAEVGRLRRRIKQLEGREKTREPFTIIGESASMHRLRKKIERIAKSKADTVLIYGESGSGKELAARAVHEWSPFANEPFVEINCASIPENLLESELFGYEKGAFTDAKERKTGLFELARGGSIFLDEIGEMPLKLQAKLLRIIEYRRFKRLGGTKDIEFSGRIIAATNRRLEEEIVQGGFRQDLYYRINAISVFVPPLRDRKDDIPALVDYLLEKTCESYSIAKPKVSASAMALLVEQNWRGNVRELKNILQRCLIFNEPTTITPDDFEFSEYSDISIPVDSASNRKSEEQAPISVPLTPPSSSKDNAFVLPAAGVALEDVEKNLVVQALERSRYNQSKACLLLGISRHALRYRLEKFGLLEATN